MGFAEDFRKFKQRVIGMGDSIQDMTEEATKNALVMPFFSILGYDVFNPQEFVPEYTCDVGTKKGEKIDYAIMRDNEPIMLIEAKRCGMKLQKQQQGQLFRYFSVNRSRIAILTNGLQYNIYSDINSPNVMDDEPFLSFNILEDDEVLFLRSIERFTSDNFDVKEILSKAVYLKYSTLVERIFIKDLEKPSDELVKYFLLRPEIKTGGRITSHIIDQYRDVTAHALRKVVGVTITQAAAAVSSNEEVFEEIPAVPQVPLICQPVADIITRAMGEDKFTYSHEGKLHNFICERFRICVPEHKPGRYVIFSHQPDIIFFANSIETVEKVVNNLCSTAVMA